MRLEQASGLELGETVLAGADTPRQIARRSRRRARARPRTPGRWRPTRRQWRPPASVPPEDRRSARARSSRRSAGRSSGAPTASTSTCAPTTAPNTPITYGSLYRDASGVAAGLRDRGVVPGERVALLLRTEPAFFHAYFGILLAGGVPVPLYPPFRADQIEEYAARQAAILRNASARVLLTFAEAERAAALLRPLAPSLTTVSTVPDISLANDPGVALDPGVINAADSLALIQYTSGSTGAPKGVALSHANLLANIQAIGEALELTGEDVGVTWLPLYHDMGLDRRVVHAALLRHADRLDVAAGVSRQARALARGDLAAPRHGDRRAELRLRPVRAEDSRRGSRRARSRVVARRAERRRGRARRDDRPLHHAVRAGRLPAGGAASGLRPGRGQPVRHRPAARTTARGRAARVARRSSGPAPSSRRRPTIRSR